MTLAVFSNAMVRGCWRVYRSSRIMKVIVFATDVAEGIFFDRQLFTLQWKRETTSATLYAIDTLYI